MKPCVAYIRVSKESENPENQEQAIRSYAQANDFDIKGFFRDIAISGAQPCQERDRFNAMISFMKDNQINNILFYDLTRLGRDFDDILATARYLMDNNFNIFFTNQPELNVGDPSIRKLIFTILAWAAEFEREQISKRIKTGLERVRAEGVKQIGRPRKKVSLERVKGYIAKKLAVTAIAKLEEVSYSTMRRKLKEWKSQGLL
jgi:DNA invertase Pin-like site-specific DNA recombinase